MKKLSLFVLACLCAGSATAQDVIIFTSGDEVEAKVVEVSDTEVKYKTWNNQTGPTWVKKTTDIFMIRYENGTKQTFTTVLQQQQSPLPNSDATPQSQQNAQPVRQDTAESIPVAARFIVGADARFGFCLTPFVLSQPGNSEKEEILMSRWPFSFDAFIDFFPKKILNIKPTDEYCSLAGFGLGVAYVNRGGSFKYTEYNGSLGSYYLADATLNMSFISLRPAVAGHLVNKSGHSSLFHFGFEIGLPAKATFTQKDRGVEKMDVTDEPYFLTGCSYGVFMELRSLGNVVNVGSYVEFAWHLFDKFFVQTIDAKNYSLSVGLTLGWSPKAIRLSR